MLVFGPAIFVRDSTDHDGRETRLEIEADMIFLDDIQYFDEVGRIESDGRILPLDRGGELDPSGTYLGISSGDLDPSVAVEAHSRIEIVLLRDEIDPFQCKDEIVAGDDSQGGMRFREKSAIIGEMPIEEAGIELDILEYHQDLVLTDHQLDRLPFRKDP